MGWGGGGAGPGASQRARTSSQRCCRPACLSCAIPLTRTRHPACTSSTTSHPPSCRYVDLEGVPRADATGALDFSSYDVHSGSAPLPVVKLIDDFTVGGSGHCGRGGVCGEAR